MNLIAQILDEELSEALTETPVSKALGIMNAELVRRADLDALARLRRMISDDEVCPLDVRDTYADKNRVRRALGIGIASSRLLTVAADATVIDLPDARRALVLRTANAQLRRELIDLLERVSK